MQTIHAALLESRLRDFGVMSLGQTVSLMKGGVYALAAFVLFEIVVAPRDQAVDLVLWIDSFVLALVSYIAWLQTAVVAFRGTVAGIVLLVVQGMAELMMFATLTPRAGLQPWHYWPLAYMLFAGVTAISLRRRGNISIAFDAGLAAYIAKLEARRKGASHILLVMCLSAGVLAAALMLLPSPWPSWIAIGYGVLGTVYSTMALFGFHAQHIELEDYARAAAGSERTEAATSDAP